VTYVELMLTVAVLAILATVALPTAKNMARRAKEKQLQAALLKIRTAIDEYHHDWERGYIESDHEHGWPESLEELHVGVDHFSPDAAPQQNSVAGQQGSSRTNQRSPNAASDSSRRGQAEPVVKVYLRRLPQDPFNTDDNPWDEGGWRFRSYDDEPDSSSWGGEGLYDVYSAAEWIALDGRTRYSEW
jgi:general secretion pathway protein G